MFPSENEKTGRRNRSSCDLSLYNFRLCSELSLCPCGDVGFQILGLMAADGQTGQDGSALAALGQITLGVCHAAALVGAQG